MLRGYLRRLAHHDTKGLTPCLHTPLSRCSQSLDVGHALSSLTTVPRVFLPSVLNLFKPSVGLDVSNMRSIQDFEPPDQQQRFEDWID